MTSQNAPAQNGPAQDVAATAITDPRRTEQVHPDYADLDRLDSLALVQAFASDQLLAVQAVQAATPQLAQVVEAAAARLSRGGRLVYAGAGTSGRLGVLDATELTPTFSWPAERAVPLIAGGERAIRQAIEGAEDDAGQGEQDIRQAQVGAEDVVIGIAASGTTPYVLGALAAARQGGALTVALANNPGAPVLEAAEYGILLDTGPEIISGSTRLKAGTAQKIALNTLSSAVMVRLGKVYGNLMVDVRATNAKLEDRARRLVQHATGAEARQAEETLRLAQGQVKVAIVMLERGLSAEAASTLLEQHGGHARLALQDSQGHVEG